MLKSDFPRACWLKEFELYVKTVSQKQNFVSASFYQFSPIDVGKKDANKDEMQTAEVVDISKTKKSEN